MTRKYIIVADDSIKGFDEGIAKLEREWGAEEIEPCDDCISREEAIRVAEQGQIQGYEWEFKKLCNLPSVTPSYKSIKTELEPSEDCISRAEAISRIEVRRKITCESDPYNYEEWTKGYEEGIDDAIAMINSVPSVTPSIPDVENDFNLGYNCGYTDAMIDIAESEE
jgi:hypothetical protein